MRQTAAEIDHAILDIAASIFATRGFTHTSVQQIADAVGYSKPGLLHRFGSKEAMYRGVLAEAQDSVDRLVSRSTAVSSHPDRLPLLLEHLFRMALARPGIASMVLAGLEPPERGVPEQSAPPVHRLVDLLDSTPSSAVRRLRIVLALRLLVGAAGTQRAGALGPGYRIDLRVAEEELVPMVVGLAVTTIRGSGPVEHHAVMSSMAGRLSATR